jgi:hypothetical protein
LWIKWLHKFIAFEQSPPEIHMTFRLYDGLRVNKTNGIGMSKPVCGDRSMLAFEAKKGGGWFLRPVPAIPQDQKFKVS